MPAMPQERETLALPLSPHVPRLTWQTLLIVLVYGTTLLLCGLGSSRVLTYHEVLYAQSAREMVASGNWVLPTFSGIPNTHKPPGNHALIALMMAVTGRQDELFVRLPSVGCAVAIACLLTFFAARWFGDAIGRLTGLMTCTTFFVLQLARLSESDMPMMLSVTIALTVFACGNVDSPSGRVSRWWLPLLFYAAVGLAFLFKGLIGPAIILSACGMYLCWQRDLRVLWFLGNPAGIVVLLTCTLGWLYLAWSQYPDILDAILRNHVGRFQGELGGSKPFWFYAAVIPLILLPWTPWAVLGGITQFRKGLFQTPLGQFLVCWMLPGLLLLSLSRFKSQHYPAPLVLPLLPLAAIGLSEWVAQRQQWRGVWLVLSGAAGFIGCVLSAAGLMLWQPKGYLPMIGVLVGMGVALAWIGYCDLRRRPAWHLGTLFGTAWVCVAVVLVVILPEHDSYRDQTLLAREINSRIPAAAPLYVVNLPRSQITYYLTTPVVRMDEAAEFRAAAAEQRSPCYVLAPEYLTAELARQGHVEVLARCASINKYLKPRERLTCIRWEPAAMSSLANQGQPTAH